MDDCILKNPSARSCDLHKAYIELQKREIAISDELEQVKERYSRACQRVSALEILLAEEREKFSDFVSTARLVAKQNSKEFWEFWENKLHDAISFTIEEKNHVPSPNEEKKEEEHSCSTCKWHDAPDCVYCSDRQWWEKKEENCYDCPMWIGWCGRCNKDKDTPCPKREKKVVK